MEKGGAGGVRRVRNWGEGREGEVGRMRLGLLGWAPRRE